MTGNTGPDPYDYSTERLLYAKASECAELRELLAAVAGDLERLASTPPVVAPTTPLLQRHEE